MNIFQEGEKEIRSVFKERQMMKGDRYRDMEKPQDEYKKALVVHR